MIIVERDLSHKTLIVIPTYNERENLPGLVSRVLMVDSLIEVLVVDDASPDGTGKLAESMADEDDRIHVICRSAKLGMGTAYVRGFEWAREQNFDRVAQMDADGSHDPGALRELLSRLDEADLVIGSRAVPGGCFDGWARHRIVLSRVASLYCSIILGWSLADPTSGYRALSGRALEALARKPVRSEGFSFQIEVAFRVLMAGLTVVEHPIRFVDRVAGRSKLSREIVTEAILVVPLLRLCSLVSAL